MLMSDMLGLPASGRRVSAVRDRRSPAAGCSPAWNGSLAAPGAFPARPSP